MFELNVAICSGNFLTIIFFYLIGLAFCHFPFVLYVKCIVSLYYALFESEVEWLVMVA